MASRLLQVMLLSVCVVIPTLARAQDAPYQLASDATLEQLISESLATRPELVSAQAEVKAQEARVPQVEAMPDPILQVGIQNDGFTSIQIGKMETSYVSIMASQTFPWPGKRRLRADIATADVKGAQSEAVRIALSTEAAVRRLYIELLLTRDRLALLSKLTLILEKAAETARTVYEAGGGSQSDILRARLELSRMKQRRTALTAQETTLVQELNRLRGKALVDVISTPSHLVDMGVPKLFDTVLASTDALTRSPELAATRFAMASAERNKELADKSYFPDLTVSAGIMPRGGTLPPMWLLSVSAPIPIFSGSKQARSVDEQRARSRSAESSGQAVEQLLQLRVRERHTALASLLETIDVYNGGLLVQSQATAESTLAQYRVGKATFASVLDANAGVLADEEGYLQALAEAHLVLVAAQEVSLESVPGLSVASISGRGSMPTGTVGARGPSTSEPGARAPGAANGANSSMQGGM